MKKQIAMFFLVLSCVCSLSAEKIVLKIATVTPARSPWEVELKKLAQEWSRITKGQVSVKFYDMNVLGGEKSGVRKLKSARPGQAAPMDGAVFSAVGLYELVPKSGIYTLCLPFLIQNQKELDRVLAVYGNEIEKPFEDAGFKLITWSNAGWLSFYTKKPFKTPGELKKQRMALSGLDSPVLSNGFKVSGFDVVDVPTPKFAQTLRTNKIEGFMAVHLFTWVTGFYKSIKYALDTKMCPIMAGFVISEVSWNRIPAQYRSEMLAAADRTKKKLNEALDASDRAYVQQMERAGITMIRLTPQEEKQWSDEFSKNIEQINQSIPGAFSLPLCNKIQSLVEPMRR